MGSYKIEFYLNDMDYRRLTAIMKDKGVSVIMTESEYASVLLEQELRRLKPDAPARDNQPHQHFEPRQKYQRRAYK